MRIAKPLDVTLRESVPFLEKRISSVFKLNLKYCYLPYHAYHSRNSFISCDRFLLILLPFQIMPHCTLHFILLLWSL